MKKRIAIFLLLAASAIAVRGQQKDRKNDPFYPEYARQTRENDSARARLMRRVSEDPERLKRDSAFRKEFSAQLGKVSSERYRIEQAFAAAHPGSMISFDFACRSLRGMEPDSIVAGVKKFSKEVRESPEAKALLAEAEKKRSIGIGKIAPDFSAPDTAGNTVALKDFRGKYVLIDFWASWCGPCRAENPHVVAAYEKYKNKNFTILAISLDKADGKDAWLKAIRQDKLAWTHISELRHWNSAIAKQYFVRGIPQNFLIGPDGKILASNLRGAKLAATLEQIL